ncbi:MAG: flagellar assembly protein FliX [Alphaproteobacteria bacterium]|nr:flagellar assembly protein FliX [Alphaproteobacteria bacterium]
MKEGKNITFKWNEFMEIKGPSKTGETKKAGKAKKAAKSDGSFGAMVADSVKETAGTAATSAIAKVDALLAVQGVESATEGKTRRKMHERGEKILRQMDHLRLAILTGNLSVGHIVDIADVVASHREKITDPDLSAVLDEVDLRAQIELAKIKKALADKV